MKIMKIKTTYRDLLYRSKKHSHSIRGHDNGTHKGNESMEGQDHLARSLINRLLMESPDEKRKIEGDGKLL
jgi:hypothetical protein